MDTRFREPPSSGSYQRVFLAFLDILGFKDMLDSHCRESPDYLLRLLSQTDFFVRANFSAHLERRIASDSILIWTDNWNDGLLAICNICSLLQTSLVKQGCLIRGAITFGNHFAQHIQEFDVKAQTIHRTSDEVIVSPALARAVELEKDIVLPRIVLDPSATLDHHLSQAKAIFPTFQVHDRLDADGRRYIEGHFTSHEMLGIAHLHSTYVLQGTTKEAMAAACMQQALAEMKEIKVAILRGLAHPTPKVVTKWEHIKTRYNEFVEMAHAASGFDHSLAIS